MVVVALLDFLSPWVKGLIGSERAGILQVLIMGLLAIYGLRYFFRFLGAIARRKD